MTKLQTAKGVEDIPPEEKILKNEVVRTLTEVFELFGFAPLETPIIERYDTLAAKSAAGEESDALREVFKLTDQGKRALALRFDLTVPLARYVAMNPTIKLPFKRYAIGRVFRDGPIKLGRTREFWQMDVDTVGTSSMLADAEIVALTESVFKKLGLEVIIKVNNRKLLNAILEQAGISKGKEEAIISIDKLNKIGIEGVSTQLKERGYTKKQIEVLFSLIKEGITLASLEKKVDDKEGYEELEKVFSYLKQMGVTSAVFDVSLARGLAYYTGTVFEVFLKQGKVKSSLAGGGRYDEMIGTFMGGGRVVPAMGISFGIVPILETLKINKELIRKTPTKLYVIPINSTMESLGIVQELRNSGVSTDLAIKKGVSKNLQYADALGIPYVAIVGENELKQGKLLLRNMQDGSEQLLAIKTVIQKLK